MVMSPPNILEVMLFRMSTRVSTRNYVQIPKKWMTMGMGFLGTHRRTSFPVVLPSGFPCMLSTSVSVGRPQKHFNANIMCSFRKKGFSFSGTSLTRPPGPRWCRDLCPCTTPLIAEVMCCLH